MTFFKSNPPRVVSGANPTTRRLRSAAAAIGELRTRIDRRPAVAAGGAGRRCRTRAAVRTWTRRTRRRGTRGRTRRTPRRQRRRDGLIRARIEPVGHFARNAAGDETLQVAQVGAIVWRDEADRIADRFRASGAADAVNVVLRL